MKVVSKLASLFLLAVIPVILLAQPVLASADDAKQFADKVGNEVLGIVQGDMAKGAKHATLKKLFVDYVDTEWVGKFVLGHYWRGIKPAQQQEYLGYYKQFLANSYTKNFEAYGENTSFNITGSKPLKRKGQYLVKMDVVQPTQQVKVDYRLRQNGGSYKIIDIVVEGVSLLATQRSEFSAIMQRKGIDELIALLKKKS